MPATITTAAAAAAAITTSGSVPSSDASTVQGAAAMTANNNSSSSNSTTSSGRHQLRPVKYDYADSFACTYVVSVVAASIAELATYPLDLTKTRLQIQGEAASVASVAGGAKANMQYRGMVATAFGIVREEGALKLWQGVTPALYRHVVYSGVRICSYDLMRKEFTQNGTQALPVWKSALCGVTAGAVAQWLASPADLVKVQIQMEGRRRLMGDAPRVHGAAHAFRQIIQRGGVKGLWKGSIPNVQRAALVNLGDLTTYDTIKHLIMHRLQMPDCHTVHVLASICAGFVAAIMGTPADVVKTRIMNQPTDELGRGLLYRGSVDCLRQTVAKEGFVALYKGFLPCWIRMAPWSLTFWLSFEQIRKMIGASSY
ncbi:mitochondrial uncoupling protein 4 isoform X1 [Drosophila nasuta]|uniref:Mitochondrial uncoupling protein 4 isoform X1 n=1 Tax=Drosophila albomicans TaxID=7291 RepID=A0A6P8Y6L1_DROAB|nr:mitochondrial uncoupling protein 4 isoform X1 [Drosophila albomicans]XP_034119105.1 mitochondrial uncoupling protein 4 isoform X1 [Drosophila albomicans]XP_034119107.1 mitochondrial uncoupling protein 4 isoform X1 [Drosophila albomicans]XP_060664712.1 mitochondrial uncoupling protein 4 isoform X1 [Drosophila nasuta]XP_060664713.1 mitochondrial uncoupling protein 4 isoform X1 [Drosophila nasuta]XP_060664714.1 mitochondrial uncoupling protein 4 isoform X1 [Drosophila nasuta]XP_060664715.1 mi